MPFRSSIDSFDEKEFMKDFAEGKFTNTLNIILFLKVLYF